jgi:integrase
MKVARQRYQSGSVRKVPRSHGFAWEFRYYSTGTDGVRRMKVQTFDSVSYPTERDVRLAVQGQLASLNADTLAGKVEMTFGMLVDRYIKEELPKLQHSTQTTNTSLLNLHVKPKWQDYRLPDMKPMEVKVWMDALPFGAASKVRARNIISRLLDLAMLWEYIPVSRNPMELIKVKGSTKRQKPIVVISPKQFKAIAGKLPEPYNLMVLVCGCLGLRVSEMLALKWTDFDWDEQTLTIHRVFTHGQIQNVAKTDASGADLPVYGKLIQLLKQWRVNHDFEYVFASPKTGTPYSDSTILTRYLKPTAKAVGVNGLGWHTFMFGNNRPAFYDTMKPLVEKYGLISRGEIIITSTKGSPSSAANPEKMIHCHKPVALYAVNRNYFPCKDVIMSKGPEKDFDPWQQPLPDFEALIERLSDPGDLVVDPFAGTGTTLIAGLNMGRRVWGCDKDAAMVEKIKTRMVELGLVKP